MRRKHPLQRFLDRHSLSQSELAISIDVRRETVNRWIRGKNVPEGLNLMRTIAYLKSYEPSVEAHDLFPASASLSDRVSRLEPELKDWGRACALCRVPWDLTSEHLPAACIDTRIEGFSLELQAH